MKHLILAAAVAAFSIQAAEPAELPVQATPKLSFVNNRSLPGKVELTETEKTEKNSRVSASPSRLTARRKSSVRKSSCARR